MVSNMMCRYYFMPMCTRMYVHVSSNRKRNNHIQTIYCITHVTDGFSGNHIICTFFANRSTSI